MSWLTTQEKSVLLFVFAALFIGLLSCWYYKVNPLQRSLPLNQQERETILKEPVDINTADFKALLNIPGIGPVLAENILEYRRNCGAFKEYDELLKIKGIGPKKLKEIRKYIFLK